MDIFLKSFTILIIFLLTNIKVLKSMNPELVFDLQEHLKSDLILIASDDNKNINLAKRFFNQTKAFIRVIDINSEKFSENFKALYQDIMVVADDKINLIEKLQKHTKDSGNLMASAMWINFIKRNISKELDNLYIPFNCEFLLIKEIDVLNYEIEEVYQISEKHPKIYSNFGFWKNKKLKVSKNDFLKRRMNLKGHRFDLAETFLKQYTQKYHHLWELFAETMNFSINYDPRDHGVIFSNGTATGIMKLIEDREIDGTVHNYLFTEERAKYFDFIFPTMDLETKFYLEQTTELNWYSYIAPFSKDVWLSILIWIIISSLVVHIINRLNRCRNSEASFFIILKAMLNQAGFVHSSNTSHYISYLMPYFLAIILTQYYSGVLLSYLTVKEEALPFKDLEEIVEDGSYKFSALNGTIAVIYFQTDPDPLATAVRQKNLLVEPDKLPTDTYTAFDQICENRWIYIGRTSNIVIRGKCRIIELHHVFMRNLAGIMVYKHFPYKEVMTRLLKKFQFAGLVKLFQEDTIYSNEEPDVFKPFSIYLAYPILLIYFIFIVFSLFILLIEHLWNE